MSGQRLDRALQNVNFVLQERTFLKMELMISSVAETKWREDVNRVDKEDQERLGGNVRDLMAKSEDFREEMRVMYEDIGGLIESDHLALKQVLVFSFFFLQIPLT